MENGAPVFLKYVEPHGYGSAETSKYRSMFTNITKSVTVNDNLPL